MCPPNPTGNQPATNRLQSCFVDRDRCDDWLRHPCQSKTHSRATTDRHRRQDKLDAFKERHPVKDDMETHLSETNDAIANLKNHASEADGDREVKLQGEIAKSETKHAQPQEHLRELRAAPQTNGADSK